FEVTSVNGSYSIGQASSTTTVTCPSTVTYTGSPLMPCSASATGVGIGGPSAPLTGGYSNNLNAGTATATAAHARAGNPTGSNGSQTFTIAPAGQTINFGALANKSLGDPAFTVSATGGASGNPVTFTTMTTPVCASGGTNGATIAIVGPGICTVRASQAGSQNYSAAADVTQSFQVAATFTGLMNPWAPPGPGTYNGMTFTSGTVFKINSTLPVKWGYSIAGVLIDSSRANAQQYPVVNVYGPLAACGDIDGTGSDTVVSYTGPGSTTTTYDVASKTWQRNVKLDSGFEGDKCYLIQVFDPVTNTYSPSF